MSLTNSFTFSQIRIELAQLNFDRNAIPTLTNLINNTVNNLSQGRPSLNNKEIINHLNDLLENLKDIYSYREEQQLSIFDQIVSEFKDILNEIEL
jgi:hypothetical protein